jgi:hypothetical protein
LLVVTLHDLLDHVYALFFACWGADVVLCVRGLDEDCIVNDNLVICPSGGESVVGLLAFGFMLAMMRDVRSAECVE